MLGNFDPSAQELARYGQANIYDYGREGDQRPYQIVYPAYKAPKFLETFHSLDQGLRECGSLCRLKGVPFRLVKWGGRVPCVPCGTRVRDNKLPGFKVVYSKAALEGFPDAMPIADFKPNGQKIVYGPDGEGKLVGQPNFVVSADPYPAVGKYVPGPLRMKYLQAVRTAMRLADDTGATSYLCSSFGENCPRDAKWFPVIYVQPGGVVARYPYERDFEQSVPGSTSGVSPVNASEYAELVAESRGATYTGQGA